MTAEVGTRMIYARLTPREEAYLRRMARRDNRTLAGMIRHILTQAIKEEVLGNGTANNQAGGAAASAGG